MNSPRVVGSISKGLLLRWLRVFCTICTICNQDSKWDNMSSEPDAVMGSTWVVSTVSYHRLFYKDSTTRCPNCRQELDVIADNFNINQLDYSSDQNINYESQYTQDLYAIYITLPNNPQPITKNQFIRYLDIECNLISRLLLAKFANIERTVDTTALKRW